MSRFWVRHIAASPLRFREGDAQFCRLCGHILADTRQNLYIEPHPDDVSGAPSSLWQVDASIYQQGGVSTVALPDGAEELDCRFVRYGSVRPPLGEQG